MTPYAPTPTYTRDTGGILNRLRRIEAWMDARGRKAWIAAMVLGFVVFWPVGLALVAYLTITNRWSKTMYSARTTLSRHETSWAATRSSGNTAFDSYKADTLRRLEEEQDAFEAFLQRLRDAKDKSEFDSFMEDRSKSGRAVDKDTPSGEY